MAEELVQTSTKNALVKKAYAERFFAQTEGKTPQDLIDIHEQWLRGQLESLDVPIDDNTWGHFYENAIATSLSKKVLSLRLLEQQATDSAGNILQALAWYHAPERASWSAPKIYFKLDSPVFVNHQQIVETATSVSKQDRGRWYPPGAPLSYLRGKVGIGASDEAPFLFRINEQYEGIQGWLGRNNNSNAPRGVRASFGHEAGILQVSFENPREFMGWHQKENGKLVYFLTELNAFVSDLSSAIYDKKKEVIAVDTWRAY